MMPRSKMRRPFEVFLCIVSWSTGPAGLRYMLKYLQTTSLSSEYVGRKRATLFPVTWQHGQLRMGAPWHPRGVCSVSILVNGARLPLTEPFANKPSPAFSLYLAKLSLLYSLVKRPGIIGCSFRFFRDEIMLWLLSLTANKLTGTHHPNIHQCSPTSRRNDGCGN